MVMAINANRARIVVALFTMAMFYASACTTICAVGSCPNQAQQTSSHDCESSPSHHSSDPAPNKPDCSSHAHPSVLFLKSGDVSPFQLSVSGGVSLAAMLASSADRLAANSINSQESNLAPPFAPNVPLYQQISVLRI